jgi:hypothetical protein
VTVLFSVDEEQLKMAEHKEDQKAEKPDSVGSEAELIGRIIQSEQKLSEYFTTIITKSVTEQIERRNMARLRMFGIISVVVREDYWQGDEPKWLETYRLGKGALHIGNLKYDSSALAWEVQVSLPIVDPATEEPLGAITIGLDPSALVETSL